MLRDAVRGVVVVATEVAEEAGKRVAGLLERSGVNVAALEQFPPSVKTLQTLAEEAVTAGRAGLDLAVGVTRGEVERVFEKVGDQVVKVGVVLSFLESRLREVEETTPTPAQEARAGGLFEAGWEEEVRPAEAEAEAEPELEPEEVPAWAWADEEPEPVAPPVKPAPVKKSAPAKKTAVVKKTATAKKTTATKKTATKKAAAKKAAPRKPAGD
ncbi:MULTISPECIES: hypothetical protein [unclassified Kitasatospora]|uniref:hypothetical protein n=1 Tax=unclassified Kitasatospora TaxID=2633591 RepID=UPI00070F5F30|nr:MULTISPECIES: hypothetical protein [unclassified Kitasatospora]KQV19989.1 hypothetical protein ASC99_21500 [Kitasatospora sp. Root107]KRB71281.1 hypothetical protein ASE03_25060 [Kitasatospora sp. Root187]